MAVATEVSGLPGLPRSLSLWWTEETEYVLQRIERWAAYARGYNRLRSARLSPGRLTMQDEPADGNRWTVSRTTNRLVVEAGWAPSFGPRRRQQSRQQPPERSGLRCCGPRPPDYRACDAGPGNCLEAYGLDHSIYFETVGEARRGRSRKGDDEEMEEEESVGLAAPPRTTLDCGDFLASDFDDLEEEAEALGLREQLSRRLSEAGGPGVVQLCRSAAAGEEAELSRHFSRLGLPGAPGCQPAAGRAQ